MTRLWLPLLSAALLTGGVAFGQQAPETPSPPGDANRQGVDQGGEQNLELGNPQGEGEQRGTRENRADDRRAQRGQADPTGRAGDTTSRQLRQEQSYRQDDLQRDRDGNRSDGREESRSVLRDQRRDDRRDGEVDRRSDDDRHYADDSRELDDRASIDGQRSDSRQGNSERWRYKRHNDEWWYWHPDNHWVYWRNGTWHRYSRDEYEPPRHHRQQHVERGYTYQGDRWSDDDQYYYRDDRYRSWDYGPRGYSAGYGDRYYGSGYRDDYYRGGGYYRDDYYRGGGYGRGYYPSRSGRVGAEVGGAIGGRRGAAVGGALGEILD